MCRRKQIQEEIAREEERLAALKSEADAVTTRLDRLRSDLARLSPVAAVPVSDAGQPQAIKPTSTREKLEQFCYLFQGRADVFPRRWENRKKKTAGYSPACFNDFISGVCPKKERTTGSSSNRSRVSCGECPSQAFIPVDEQQVLRHMQGRHVMGIYPMLEDETCWLLAADFDRESWAEDISAFSATCRQLGVPVAIERSRSGKGAHAWFFFTSPVRASTARKMGCFLITETMSRRHDLSMASYDRLFPSQDTLPRGGFGNLIALPFQGAAVKQGNTVFLDDSLVPHPDQWAFLAGVQRMSLSEVQRITDEATTQGRVIGVRTVTTDEEYEEDPWNRPPSGQPRQLRFDASTVEQVKAVHAQRLFVDKAGLPDALLSQIKRLAAFQNPEFYKKQRMRLSTRGTPRVIDCTENQSRFLVLPRGCLVDLEDLLQEHDIHLDVGDERITGKALEHRFRGSLTPVQEQAVRSLLEHDTGVFVAPPGVGKTVVGIYMVAARERSTLILVHRQNLLDQWRNQLSLFLGIPLKAIGQIGGGRRKPNGELDVAMLQSLERKGAVADQVAGYGHVIVDECHHIPALSFERVLAETKACHVLGLTATPQRRDGHHPIIHMQLGPTRFSVSPRSELARRPFVQRLVERQTGFVLEGSANEMGIQEIYRTLATDRRRNRLILDDLIAVLEEGRSPIVLTERKDHLDFLAERIRPFARHLVVLKGGMGVRQRRAAAEQLASIPESEERVILATGRYIGEGFDDPRLDTLFLTLPISWKGTLMQYTGRLHRLHPGKQEVRIYDYVDSQVPMLQRMYERRLSGYRSLGYTTGEDLLFRERKVIPEVGDPVVEYDEEVVQQLDLLEEPDWEP